VQQPARKKFLGQDLFLVEATEPTNIIWENRHFTPAQRFTRTVHAVLLISVVVFISFLIIYFSKVVALNIAAKYPPQQCDIVMDAYDSTLKQYAFYDYYNYSMKNESGYTF
jgi:hypothetical protein